MLSFLYVYSDHSILECYNLFSGVELSMRSFFVIPTVCHHHYSILMHVLYFYLFRIAFVRLVDQKRLVAMTVGKLLHLLLERAMRVSCKERRALSKWTQSRRRSDQQDNFHSNIIKTD